MKTERGFKIFGDGAVIRLHNKRIAFTEKDGEVFIWFRFADKEADKAACKHYSIKGKVRETHINMSEEAMQALVLSYIHYKKLKKQQGNQENKSEEEKK